MALGTVSSPAKQCFPLLQGWLGSTMWRAVGTSRREGMFCRGLSRPLPRILVERCKTTKRCLLVLGKEGSRGCKEPVLYLMTGSLPPLVI